MGVVGAPEIEVHEVRPEDTYIIIATDGVFEFLTNQNVVDVAQAVDQLVPILTMS